jgi:ketosteroid isomerase-like protein
MRIHVALLAGLLVGCSSETVAQPPPPPVNWNALHVQPTVDAGADIVSAKERALPDAYAAALSSQGFAQLGPLLDDEAHFASPGMDDARGRSAVVHAHEILLGSFDQRRLSVGRVWRTPSEQTIEWTFSGTQERDWLGVPATHRAATFKGLTLLWTKDDGSIVDVHLYVDVAVVKAQLGVGPKDLLALQPPLPGGGAPQVFEQVGSAEEKANVAAIRASLDALEKNDEAAYSGAMTEDVEVHTPERAQPFRGRDGAKAYFKAMHKAIGQLDTTVDGIWGVGQFVVVEYSVAGEQIGPLGWIAPQRDKVIRLQVADVDEMRDGKIARVWRYDNPAQIAASRGP